MRHIVLGQGNLGHDLAGQLQKDDKNEVFVAAHRNGWCWPQPVESLAAYNPDIVWCAIGAGSVASAKLSYTNALSLHAGLPVDLMTKLPSKTTIVLFSTDYAASEEAPSDPSKFNLAPKSLYAMTKIHMEKVAMTMQRANTIIVRITSLYGSSRPQNTFPGKLISNHPNTGRIYLPLNTCTPTPTEWLAKMLISRIPQHKGEPCKIHHLAPGGSVEYLEWGRQILGQRYEFIESGYDTERPARSGLGSTLGPVPMWSELWAEYGKRIFNL